MALEELLLIHSISIVVHVTRHTKLSGIYGRVGFKRLLVRVLEAWESIHQKSSRRKYIKTIFR